MRLQPLTLLLSISTGIASSVVQLQKLNFEPLVYRSDNAASRWFIKFYAPWCVHCRALQPLWEELAASANEAIRFAEVDCTSESEICSNFAVKGYPTLVLVDAKTRLSVTFTGQRTKEAILAFAKDADFKAEADASATSAKGGASVKNTKKTVTMPNPKGRPIKEVPNAGSALGANVLPDEAELGPPLRESPVMSFDPFACLDMGPFSRAGNMYFFGLPLIAGIYASVYFLAGGRKSEEEKKND